ncbi:hypothetical protein BU15DRAFT_41623 [Melanogaster broomeanus]|nr:hypothetical protein BU15DRAFT_41623 [Melanogaster broomeanus]
MSSFKPPHLPLYAGTATTRIRRKPVFTYQSPAASASSPHLEKSPVMSPGATKSFLPRKLPQTQLSRTSSKSELSQHTSTAAYKLSRHHIPTLLPLYHPFGALALSLPDLDPTMFGLPAPVAIFDDPTRRSNRMRRPAAKVRDANEAATPPLPPFIEVTPTLEVEPKDRPSPRKRRSGGGGGGGSKRKRKDVDDGDATYPAKRSRNPRSSGVASAVPVTRSPSEEVSPPASVRHSGASPAADVGQSELVEEKKPERRTTRSRGAIARRDSTGSEATVTSVSASVSATNGAAPRAATSEETMEIDGPASNENLNDEATAPECDSGKADSETPVPERQES